MSHLKVYGIPTCSTCTKALKWLDAQSIAYEFVNTKEQPPSASQLQDWVAALGNKPLRNTSGKSYRALGDAKAQWEDADWVRAFSADAMLLKRPLFVQGDQAIFVGFRDPAKLAVALGL
ncbi:Spx/MgsR family RNA polymerase-binding regulatory protein [filamentous cyanobacterium LEGE 11480]|uniref:Spx/MgsR family RNA polymerase-binding regulatory protein n=1 Tax=Romeriopsis navalis LEGE 11480 TaxID=2777977 RepID=A0A928VQI9_9CYAN|nr:Spx/MgsR family RNA polymerase-binding regulatory protein [Romeriopsis navalis]MBE9032826.1 Spx/MgsR family RNA polymerase-binding regulatory protein [Romeriopsis navalis LEGE 11480]